MAEEPLCYQWCGLGIGLCLQPLGHDGDCWPMWWTERPDPTPPAHDKYDGWEPWEEATWD